MGKARPRAVAWGRHVPATVVLALLAAACGGGGGAKAATAHFASHWQSVVGGYQQSVQTLQAQGRSALASGSEAQVSAVITNLRELTGRVLGQVQALTPPATVNSLYARAIKDLKAQETALSAALSADARHNQKAVQAALTKYVTALSDWLPLTRQIALVGAPGGASSRS